tara:strand:+ start:2180 stop:2458 length:279 start_codon:yes stop_codon:yes gene_type:complete
MNQKMKILYAEDEESLALIVKESLESKDFEVLHCNNGDDALEIFDIKNPDIIVLDIMMPKKDGFTVAKEIRQKCPHYFPYRKNSNKRCGPRF